MSLEFELPLFSFIFLLLITILYLVKQKIDLAENNYYMIIIISSLFEALLSTIVHLMCASNSYDVLMANYYPYINWVNKIVSTQFFAVFLALFFYIIIISFKTRIKNYKRLNIIFWILVFIFFGCELFTNVTLIKMGTVTNVAGLTPMLAFVCVAILMVISFIVALINIKKYDKRFLPIYIILPFMILMYCLILIFPNVIIYDVALTFLVYIMYFTIENPDVKLLNEYEMNRRLTEQNIEDKSNMLFKVSQDVKNPIQKIELLSANIVKSDELDNIKIDATKINMISKNITEMINEVFDISNLDIKNVKIMKSTYNTYNMFNQIILATNEKLNNKLIFKFSVDSNLPESLYGDSVKIKQILSSLIMNSINNTEKGFIDLDVSFITRYDVCRMIIKISDSGCGMELQEINEILCDYNDIHDDEDDLFNKLNMDLKTIKKSVTLLGGNLLIRSDVGVGSEFIIVLDQKIVETEKEKTDNKFSNILSNKKKVLLIDDDYRNLELYKSILQKSNLEVITTMYGNDLVDKIRNGNKYDLILIDDEMEPSSAVSIIKKVDISKEKVVVMLGKSNEIIKEHYIKDYGFVDYLLKNDYQKELERIIKKHL